MSYDVDRMMHLWSAHTSAYKKATTLNRLSSGNKYNMKITQEVCD